MYRTSPLASSQQYLFSMIICLTTKSGDIVFDYVRVKTTTDLGLESKETKDR